MINVPIMMNWNTLGHYLDDLKFLNRLNKFEFIDLLFPNSPDEAYNNAKWNSWNEDSLHFLWSCSHDKLMIIADYCNEMAEEAFNDSKDR